MNLHARQHARQCFHIHLWTLGTWAMMHVFCLFSPTHTEAFHNMEAVLMSRLVFRRVKGTSHAMTMRLGIEEGTTSSDPDHSPEDLADKLWAWRHLARVSLSAFG